MVKSPIKVIESGNVPTTDNLGKGQVAFGQVGGSVKFYGSDGTTVTELNAGTQINSIAPLMVETVPTIASGDNMKGSIAIGNSAQVSSPGTTVSGAVAIGDHAIVGSRGVSGIAIGRYANVPGNDIAIGNNAKSIWDATHSGGDSIVIGNNAKSDTTGVNIGSNIAIGYGAVTKKRSSIAIGYGASADDYSICIGHTNYGEGASGNGSIAIGQSTDVPASGSICISSGSSAEVTGGGSILIGSGYLSSPSPSVGNSNVVAIGRNIVDNANSSVVIGAYATIDDNANGAVVIGSQSNATEPYTFSVGSGDATMNLTDDMDEETKERIQARAAATTRRIVNVTDPRDAQDAATKNYVDTKIAETPSGTEVNTLSKTKTEHPVMLGSAAGNSLFFGEALGDTATIDNADVYGVGRVSGEDFWTNMYEGIAVAPGGNGVVIGRGLLGNYIIGDGTAMEGSESVIIGNMETRVGGNWAVAIGGATAEADDAVAIGRWSYTQSSDAFAVGRDDATYGSPEEFDESMARRIVGVKDPIRPHDAANKNYTDTALDQTVQRDTTVTASESTVNLGITKGNANDKSSTTSQVALPVASATSAGVLNASTFQAIQNNAELVDSILDGTVSINNLPSDPSQEDLTNAWKTATSRDTVINGATIDDQVNAKTWKYYTNIAEWRGNDAVTPQIAVNQWTNTAAGIIKGSTAVGQIFAEADGTGSVNGWDDHESRIADNTTNLTSLQTEVDSLTTAVNSKANQSDLTALQTTVTQQTETISQLQATISQLQTTIDNLTLKTEEIL